MQYQRRHKEEKEDQDQTKSNNNVKKSITTTNKMKATTEKKPSRIATKAINISTKSNMKKEEKKNEKIKKISYTKAEKQYKKIESPSIMEAKPQNNRIHYSSRYHNRNQEEISPIFKENISGIEDAEYNIHTLNVRKSPDNISYGRNSIENERQIQLKNYPPFDNHQTLDQETFKTNTTESIKMNNSNYNTNIKSYRPPMIPQNKMSPIQHYDDGNSSYENKRYTEQRNRYANYLSNKMNTNPNIENINLNISNINNNIPKGGRNTFGRIRGRFSSDANSPSYNQERLNSQNSNRVSYKELKKIVKKFNKVYDPYKNEKGLLIKQSQVTLPGASDEIFNNRYRVLSKMNKLSNILLAKQKKFEEDNLSSRGNSREPNTFERDRSLSRASNSRNKNNSNSKRLLLVSLAMMSGKGLNSEDKTILRRNRIEKGGVVDLAQEKIKKNKFKIIKASKVSGGGKTIIKSNPKYREKAAKIIQAWWKELKDIYNYKLSQIIKIQSIWKGRWVRKNIYDLLYLNYLYLSFCEKIEKVLKNKMTRYAMNKLIDNQKKYQDAEHNKLKGLILKADKKRISFLRNFWDNWIKKLTDEKNKKNKGKNLIQIRADKENKLGKLRTAFTIWKYNIKMEKIKNKYGNKDEEVQNEDNNIKGQKIIKITKISEKESIISPRRNDNIIEKDKFKGLMHILDGVNNYHKKQAFYETKPKIIDYLKNISKEELLKNIIEKKAKKINYIIKKTIYKWITKTIKISSFYNKENEKANNDSIKKKIFLKRIENIKNKQKKILLRRHFYRYLKIVLLMGKKEERQKLLDIYKNDTNFSKNESNNKDKDNIKDKEIRFSLNSYVRRKRIKKIGLNNIYDNLEGTIFLEKFILRHTFEDILYCFLNKLDNELVIEYLIKMIKIKEKVTQNILKRYFDKWKNNSLMKKNDDLKYKLFIKTLKIIIGNNKKQLLSKRMYQWQKTAHILNGKDNLLLKSKNIYTFDDHIKKFVNKRYGPSFFDKLKHTKKDNAYNQLLKKNIMRQENKKKQFLLKNFFNNWKNKVADYEIWKLKGKLLLKLYDKYNTTKAKEFLGKIFSKWENNTIFLDKIKNKINREKIDELTKMNNKNKIIILLKAIIRNINRKNNDAKLRKCLKIWKKNIQDRTKTLGAAFLYILKIFRDNNIKYFLNKLNENRKGIILKKLILNYAKLKRKDSMKEYFFRRWIYITKSLKQIANANIIQKYCLFKLRNKMNVNRWKKLVSLLKNKNKINDAKSILNYLKKYMSILKLFKALKGNNKNNIFDKKHMAFFFDKLKDLLNDLRKQNNSYQFLKRIINKQNNRNNNILLKNAINKWKNKIADYEIGWLKGKLLSKMYDKYKNGKIKDILKKTISKWKNNTIFLDKIKNKVNQENMNKYNIKSNKDKTIIIIKSIIRNINRKNNKMKLHKYFNDWKNNIQDRNKRLDKAVIYIIKIIKIKHGKYTFKKLKENKKDDILKKIINKKEKPKKEILDSYFSRWIYITKKKEQLENANIIQKFCLINLRNRVNEQRWKKLYLLLKNKLRNKDVKNIINQLKKYLSIMKMIKALKGKNKENIYDKKNKKYFFDKLKELLNDLNNQYYYYLFLKRIINKQNNQKNNKLLKNAINKWKNKVADYEIGKLKGKLLLKIYDKYNGTKVKDIIKKTISRWENNTIFLDKIKNKVNKENTDKFTKINIKDKILIILKSIIRNINRKNNDIKLRKCLKIWKKNIQDRTKTLGAAGLYILKIFKMNNTKYFFDKLKDNKKNKREEKLKSIINKNGVTSDKILDSYLSKWRYINKKLEQENNAKIIQRFCGINLRKLESFKKWKRLYLLLREINRKNDIKNALNYLRKYINIIKLIKALKGNNKDNIYDKKNMRYFFDKLKDLLIDLNNQDYAYQIVKKIIIKNNNNNRRNILKRVMTKWRNEVADYEIGRLKGKLLQKMYDKYKTTRIKEVIKKTISKWENNTIFLDKIKDKINKENNDKYSKINKKDRALIILKSILRNINRKENEKLLRKYFNRWKKNINDKNKNINNGIKIIIKIIKLNKGKELINNLKYNKKDNLLKKIIKRNEIPNDRMLNAYFNRWRYINKKLGQIDNANIIQRFCEMKLFDLRNRNRWNKLYSLLKNKNRKNEIKDILNIIKYYVGIKKLTDIIIGNNKRNIFDLLNSQKDFKKIKIILIEIFEKLTLKDNENLLKNYFLKWKNNTRKKNNKEEALDNMMKMLEMKTMKNAVNTLSDASLIDKLLNDIRKARALYFIRNIKNEGKKNNLYNNLAKDLIDSNDDLLKEKSKFIIDKIIKIYTYKVLSTLFDHLNEIQNYIHTSNIKAFLHRLYLINMSKKRKKYRKTVSYERNPILEKGMKLNINKKPSIKRDEKNNKIIVYKELTPFLVKYINRKFKDQKKYIFDTIRFNSIGLGDKFCKLLKAFSKKTQIPDKEDLVDSLKYYVYMKLTRDSGSDKLYYLIRKSIIRKILNISKAVGNLNRLLHLINITTTHKKIAKDRWLLRLIKKWRFITFIKKMAMKKMELMYKDLHVTYLEMADSVLKDGSPLGPNGANFLYDINKDKYLYDFYDPYLVKGAKPYKAIKKQYVFEPIGAEIEKRIKTIEEIKTVEKIKEINRSYYDDNDNNKGKYNKKFTVRKTKKVEVKPKKTGKIKIKKFGITEKDEGKGETKISLRYKDSDNQEYLRESIKSEIKDSIKGDLSESINSKIRDSFGSDINISKKSDYKSGYGFDERNYENFLKNRSENIKGENIYNNNSIYLSKKSYDDKNNEKK